MSKEVNQAARVTGPVASTDATWRKGVVRVAFTGATQSEAFPTTDAVLPAKGTLGGRWIRIAAVGGSAQWAFGYGAAPTIVSNAVAAGGPPKAPLATSGATLFQDVPEQILVPSEATHIAWLGSNATGFLEFYCSDQPIV